MTVITNQDDIVVEICLIPGLGYLPEGWHCYFPVTGKLPNRGEVYHG